MTEESGVVTLSVHASFDGAAKVIETHKQKERDEWKRMYSTEEEEPFPFGTFQLWSVEQIEVLP